MIAGMLPGLSTRLFTLPCTASPYTDSSIYFYDDVSTESCLRLKMSILEEEQKCLEGQIDHIDLHIQSHGGSLSAALAVCDTMERCKIPIHTYIEGTVASAASLLSVCGTERYMSKSSTLLLHQPSITLGNLNSDGLQDESYNMQVMYNLMMNVYTKHSTQPPNKLREIIGTERVLTAPEAKKMGLVDIIL